MPYIHKNKLTTTINQNLFNSKIHRLLTKSTGFYDEYITKFVPWTPIDLLRLSNRGTRNRLDSYSLYKATTNSRQPPATKLAILSLYTCNAAYID